MRVFICEYVTSGGLRDKRLPELLLPGASLIRDALIADVEELPGIEIVVAHDDRLPPAATGSVPVAAGQDPFAVWSELARHVDAVWPVGPESDGILQRMAATFSPLTRRCIASAPDTLAITTSKGATARHLATAGIPCVPAFPMAALPTDLAGPLISKPDQGSGCAQVHLWPDRASLPAGTHLVVQPFVPGPVLELSVLVHPDGARLLTANPLEIHHLVGVLAVTGATVGAEPDRNGTFAALARQVVDALPGLSGIIGIDVILTSDGPKVLEINARPTPTYAALHAALGVNPATFLPQLMRSGRPPALPALPPARPVVLKMR
ncbi:MULTISPECIES: ATP-grasp domain-containing protein [unclassified Xanthobacter]|uniref:ATP-grasp domain-containing protein n=1 Tax=unclassified Xanthobacter TaxID=2623496 RepID=UPI001EDE2C9C|nr:MULTISPECIES: ATP-grasp domain-containing protein [unclassified Xanthobacter]